MRAENEQIEKVFLSSKNCRENIRERKMHKFVMLLGVKNLQVNYANCVTSDRTKLQLVQSIRTKEFRNEVVI